MPTPVAPRAAESPTKASGKPNRTRVGNRSGISVEPLDGRTTWAKRFREILDDLTAQLGGQLTAAEDLQVRTVAGLQLRLEQLQARVLRGEDCDDEQLVRLTHAQARALAALRKDRKPTKAAPGHALNAYLANRGEGAK